MSIPGKAIRWAVVRDADRKCVAGPGDARMGWTYDRDRAELVAQMVDGRVVDADQFVENLRIEALTQRKDA